MGIQINGATDSITAIDGTIDVVSAIGNAGVVTATAFVGNITGNVTGNINHTSNLELQVGGVTRGNFDSNGKATFTTPGGDDALLIKGDNYTSVRVQSARDSASDHAMFQMLGSRGTNASPSIIQSGDTLGTLSARGYDGNSYASSSNINFEVDGTPGDGDMPGRITFSTAADGSESPTEKLRITSSGSVGIGSVTPGGVLDLYHASNNTILNVKSGDTGSVINLIDSATRSSIEQNGASLKIISDTSGTYANSNIRLQVDGSTKMLVDNGGKIGIGTVSPATMHHLYSESGGLYTRFEAPAGQVNFGNSNGAGVIHVTSTSEPLKFLVNGSNERLRITSSGRVGINQTAPQAMLQVDYDYNSSEIGLRLRAATGSGTKTWQLSEINGNAGVFTLRNASNGYNILNVDGANQRIGINDTSPERTMDIRGSNCMLQLEGTAGNGRQWSLVSSDDATGTSVDGGPPGAFVIYDDTSSTRRFRIQSDGNSEVNVSGGSFKAEGTGAYGMSIHNTNSPSMGHLFIFGDNGLIRFRNNSSVYTAQMGYNESTNALFLYNQEGGTTLSIIDDGVKINDNEKFLCGNDSDLQIYHNNSNAYIKNGTGQLLYRSDDHTFENAAGSTERLRITSQGSVFVKSTGTVPVNQAEAGHYSGNNYVAGHAMGLMVKRAIHVSDSAYKGQGGMFLSHSRHVACNGTTYNMMTLHNREGCFIGDVYVGFSASGSAAVRHYKFHCYYGANTLTDVNNPGGRAGGDSISANISSSNDAHFFQVTPNQNANGTHTVTMTIIGQSSGTFAGDYYTVSYN